MSSDLAKDRLLQIITRIEDIDNETKRLRDDRKNELLAAVAEGFDKKALLLTLKERQREAAEREEERMLLDTYLAALSG